MPVSLSILAAALSSDARQSIRLARAYNIPGLLFESQSSALDFTTLSATGQREFRHLLSDQRRALVGFRHDLDPKGFSPVADIDRALGSLEKSMKAAADLGSPLLCVDLGRLPVAPTTPTPKPKITREQAGLIILPTFAAAPAPETSPTPAPANIDPNFLACVNAALVDLGRRADRYNCVLAFRSELSPFSGLERAIKTASCPWFGIDLDPVDLLRDDWTPSEFFDHLGPLVRHVRARDALKGSGQRTQPAVIGKGNVDYAELLQLLDDAGYNGWVTIDPLDLPDRPAAVGAALKRLLSS